MISALTTEVVITATVIVLLAYDAYAIYKDNRYTISQVVLHLALNYPIVPFLFGVLMGHLFWQNC